MTNTIVGYFESLHNARKAIANLTERGFDRDDISLVAGNVENLPTELDDTAEAAADGALAGGVMGGLTGIVVGLGLFAIPGLGPILAAGPLAAGLIGAGVGAASGSLLSALLEWGIDEEYAAYYAEGIRRGGAIVVVRAEDETRILAQSLLEQHGSGDISAVGETWRQEGWNPLDDDLNIYLGDAYATYQPGFESHYTRLYGDTSHTYDSYDPAYRYGYTLARDARYADRDWEYVAPLAARRWENDFDEAWDDVKSAVRHAWESVREALDDAGDESADVADDVKDSVKHAWNEAADEMDDFADEVDDELDDAGDAIADAADDVEDTAEHVWHEVADEVDDFADEVDDELDDAGDAIADAADDVEDTAEHVWHEVADEVDEFTDEVADEVDDARETVARAFGDRPHRS